MECPMILSNKDHPVLGLSYDDELHAVVRIRELRETESAISDSARTSAAIWAVR